nr:ATP-binding cassette domain-containing protein [Rhodovulum imhoffii]
MIAGANGSGKTTLLKLITGQLRPQSGQAHVSAPWSFLDQHVGLPSPGRTLHESFQRMNPDATTQMAHAALARFGLRAGDAQRCIADLSGGERVRAGWPVFLAVRHPRGC